MRNGIAMTDSALARKSTIANPWRAIVMTGSRSRAFSKERGKLDRIIERLDSLYSELTDYLSWQRFIEKSRDRVETKTLRGIAHAGNDILAADERYAYSILQDQLARQIMGCADWHEVDSGDGKNICIEVDAVIKPNRHTLGDD